MTAYSSVAGLAASYMRLQRLRVRAVGEAAGMPGHHAGLDVVAAEEIAVVIEDHLVEVVVVVEERHLQRRRIGLERPRHEGADDEAVADPGRVRRRRQVIAVAHQRPDVLDVEPHRHQIAVPAHGVQRIERIGHRRQRLAPLDDDRHSFSSYCGLEGLVDVGRIQHRLVVEGVAADQPALGRADRAVGCIRTAAWSPARRLDAPHRPRGSTM